MPVVVIEESLPETCFRLIKVIGIENIKITQKIEIRRLLPRIIILGIGFSVQKSEKLRVLKCN